MLTNIGINRKRAKMEILILCTLCLIALECGIKIGEDTARVRGLK